MPRYSQSSLDKLKTCHPLIQLVFKAAIKFIDLKIICGVRSQEDQKKAFMEGRSKLDGVNKLSKHQANPRTGKSHAVDAGLCPIDWNTNSRGLKRWYFMGGFILGMAAGLGVKLRWGGDWDRDIDFDDQTFNDLPHFELVEE